MKKILITLTLGLLLFANNSVFASFPVVKKQQTEVSSNVSIATSQLKNSATESTIKSTSNIEENAVAQKGDDKTILVLLWLFLGGFAAHRWYAGKPTGANILFILTAGGCGIWAIIDLINILTDKF